MSKNKVKFKYGAGSPPSTISNGTLLFNYTEGKVFFDIEGERYDLNTASRVDVNTEEVNEYRPIVTTKDNLLYSVDPVEGKPMYNPSTGDISAKTFSAKELVSITDSEGGKDLGFKISGKSNSIGFIIGSGNENWGLFDYSDKRWVIFKNIYNELRIEDQILAKDIYPKADDSYSLGSESLRWSMVYAKNFKGHLKGTADFANNLSSNPIISSGTTNPNSITVSAGYKLSNEFVVPYSNTAGSVAIETNPVNDYKPIVVHEGNSLFSSDTGDDVPMCNFYTGELKAKTFTGTLNGAASDLSGHNESSLESFNFRASAGERSIKDDFANVKAIYGNSVVWNQKFTPQLYHYTVGLDTSTTEDSFVYATNGESVSALHIENNIISIIPTHIYYFCAWVDKGDADYVRFGFKNTASNSTYGAVINETEGWQFLESIYKIPTTNETTLNEIVNCFGIVTQPYNQPQGNKFYVKKDSIRYCDLTQMFGAGNEPTTVDEFYACMPQGIDPYAYNEGEIVNMNIDAVKTVGFNQWDEEVVYNKTIDFEGNFANGNYMCSKNFIPILPNTTYYCKRPRLASGGIMPGYFIKYDENKKTIGKSNVYISILPNNTVFEGLPPETRYIRIMVNAQEYGSTYNNDICINLSHTGYKNGTYEPYETFTRELSVIAKYFPEGMKSAGAVRDEIRWDSSLQKWVAVQNVGVVDLGDLSWSFYVNDYGVTVRSAPITGMQESTSSAIAANIMCSRYNTIPFGDIFNDGKTGIGVALGSNRISVSDPQYQSENDFVAALNGVELNYPLAESIITPIEEIVNLNYLVWDFGTEEALSNEKSTAFMSDISYQFNAVDRIRDNERNLEIVKDTYVKSDGKNASGSWNIDISGTAAVAETAFALYSGGGNENTPVYFDSHGYLKVCTNIATLADLEWEE